MQPTGNYKPIVGLLREPVNVDHMETNAAIVEWENGEHTHISFEVMTAEGSWEPLTMVVMAECVSPEFRRWLRQPSVFRLAWYGQVGEPSKKPQRLVPEQENLTSPKTDGAPGSGTRTQDIATD